MKHRGALTALAAIVFLGATGAAVGEEAKTTPPKNLKKVGDHWTPWDPPPAGPEAYIIQKGDTLWDLAGKWFSDPFLWPQIWDENRYILDSHWIYPGDPLVVPGRPTVVPGEGVPPVTDAPAEPAEPVAEKQPPAPLPPPLLPMADESDLYCSGAIETDPAEPTLWIQAHDIERDIQGEGDVVFLSGGSEAGISAGDEFAVLRRIGPVTHPETGDEIGTMVRSLGRLRVMLVHENSATAVIEMSCEDIHDGDELRPWNDLPVPMLETLPEFDRWDPTPSGGASGHIVATRDSLGAVGDGYVVFTDLGRADVTPGDVVTLYRARQGDLPRQNLGQAVILTVNEESSSAKIVVAVRESHIGDRVEVLE